jgi:hypothetical protein
MALAPRTSMHLSRPGRRRREDVAPAHRARRVAAQPHVDALLVHTCSRFTISPSASSRHTAHSVVVPLACWPFSCDATVRSPAAPPVASVASPSLLRAADRGAWSLARQGRERPVATPVPVPPAVTAGREGDGRHITRSSRLAAAAKTTRMAVLSSRKKITMQKKIPHHIKLVIHAWIKLKTNYTSWLYFARRTFWI